MDGGFETQTNGAFTVLSSIGNTTQRSDWTLQNTTSASATINSTGGRSGPKYATLNNSNTTAARVQSPTAANGAIANTTAYTVQFYYKTSGSTAVTNFQRNISPDGTGFPGTYNALTMSGTSGAWTLVQVSQTSGSSSNGTKYGIGLFRLNNTSATSFDVDDYVMYAGAADNSAPNSPGSVTATPTTGSTTSSLDVSWGAASGGVDGGGYVVVRYAVSPDANGDPNQQGIYSVNNTITTGTNGYTGTIRYIGTGTSFSDGSLLNGTTYYYKVYTVDKAFNYSGETQGNGTTAVANPTTTSISPTSAQASSGAFTLTVNGTNFFSGSVVTWNGSNRTTTFVSPTQLTASISNSDISSAGSATVGVTNAGAATPNSNTQTFTISGGVSQTITFNSIATKNYGDAAFDPGATASSGLTVSYTSLNTTVATVSGNMVTIVGAGTATIRASQSGNGTYAAATPVDQTLTVNPKTLTVSGATAQNKIYDGSTAAIITGATLVGVINSDNVTVSGGGTFASAGPGTGISVTAALTLGNTDAYKYSLTQPTGLSADIIAPLLAWDFAGGAGNEASVAATSVDANLNSSNVTRGAGINAASLPNGFSSTNYTASGTLSNAVTNNQYFQFTLNPKAGYQASLSTLDANLRRSSTGPNAYQWKYSLDGFATAGVDIGSPVSFTNAATTGVAQTQIDLSGISALQNISTVNTVTFRLYPYGASATGGTFAFGLPTTPVNDIAITGTTAAAPTPDIDISAAHPAAGNADQGTTDVIIGSIALDISTANAYLLGASVTTAGTYTASDITDIKFWYNTVNNLTGATQVGTTQAAVGSGNTASVSGLTTTFGPGHITYLIVTASIASSAVPGHTISIGTTAFANLNFASGNKTGTNPVAASNAKTISQLNPTVTISTAHPAAGNVAQNSINNIIGSIKLDITVTSATLTGLTITTAGTYQLADLQTNALKFWINSTNNLTGATQLGTAQPSVGPGNNVSVSGLSSSIPNGGTRYLLVTADIAYNAVAGRTVQLGSTAFSNITFVSADMAGTDPAPSGNFQTITAVTPSIAVASNGPTASSVNAPATNVILYGFTAAVTVNSTALTGVTIKGAGTYTAGEFVGSSVKVWYNTTNTFGTATVIGSGITMVNPGSNLIITGLNQVIAAGTTGYFWITGNLISGVTSGHTYNTTATALSNFTFSQGTKTGTAAATGVQTFYPQPTITEIYVPQYIQGNTATNSTRVPYVYRVKIGNLLANTTYRYFNSVVNGSDNSTATGAGVAIYPSTSSNFTASTSPGLSTAGTYSTFTTDASGNYTGWFITEPSGNTRFTPGTTVYMRINLNDGGVGTSVTTRVTTSAVTVINFVASAGAANGTGLRGTSSGTAKNLVLLYDNVNGTGRPISGTYIESDGYANVSSYVGFYSSVEAVAGAWGAIIPNTLPNGIRRIEQRSLANGAAVNCPAISLNGTWPSGTNTINPTGGTTALVISSTDAPLNTSAATWLGVNNNWNDAANWICGVPNSSTTDIIIPNTAAVMPKVYTDVTVRNVTFQGSAATVDLGVKTLTIAGAVSGAGTFKGSDFSGLVIGGTAGTLNFTSGSRILKTLSLTTGATATLGTALDITSANFGGTLTVASGATLTTGGNLTLKSSVNGTASVGTSAGTVSGNVVVERFIPKNAFRAWRLLSVPVQGSQTFHQSWQENQAAMANGVPGYGTLLTSTAGGNGYDAATQGNSLLSFTNGNPGSFTAVGNTNNAMATNSGYFVYIRGDRSASISGGAFNPTATTLRTTGSLYMGNQSSITLPANNNVMVGNVYASAIDFTTLTKSGVTSFKVWDPKLQGTSNIGAYQSFSASNGYDPTPGGGSYGSTPNTRIESGQAFILNSVSGGSVQLTEAAKTTSSRNVFKTSTTYKQFKTSLIAYTTSGLSLADGNSAVFDSSFSNGIDNDDVVKQGNFGENFAILRGGVSLALEARQPIATNDTIFFRMWNMKQQQYRFQFVAKNLNTTGLTAVLHDNFLGTTTPLNVVDTTFVDFTVTSDANSSAQERFKVVFKVSSIMPVTFTNVRADKNNNKVNVSWRVESEQNMTNYEVEHSLNGNVFEKIGTVKSKGNAAANDYGFVDQSAIIGDNYYRIKGIEASGKVIYSAIVKVKTERLQHIVSISPNPIVGNRVNLEFSNMPQGEYKMQLLNTSGQILFNKIIAYEGENNVKSIILPSGIVPGIYQLQLIEPAGLGKTVQKLIISNN